MSLKMKKYLIDKNISLISLLQLKNVSFTQWYQTNTYCKRRCVYMKQFQHGKFLHLYNIHYKNIMCRICSHNLLKQIDIFVSIANAPTKISDSFIAIIQKIA